MKQNRCKDCHWWKDGDAFEIQSDGKFLPCTNIGVDGWEHWLDTQQEPEDCDGYCKRGEYVPSGVWAGVAKLLTALDMAISALRAQQEQESKPLNGWSSVKDRLPEDQVEVLVLTRSKKGMRNVDKGYWSIDHFVHRGCAQVTHWMPLPELPEREKTDE